jgi:hypothetical protein
MKKCALNKTTIGRATVLTGQVKGQALNRLKFAPGFCPLHRTTLSIALRPFDEQLLRRKLSHQLVIVRLTLPPLTPDRHPEARWKATSKRQASRIFKRKKMDRNDDNIFSRLFKTLETLATLVGFIFVLMGGCYTLHRIPFHFRRYQSAPSALEREFFMWKLLACCSGGYAFLVMLMLFSPAQWFADYWLAVCVLWTDHGGFGDAGHIHAIAGDMFLTLLACGIFHLLAARLGKVRKDCNGDEMFLSST